MRHIRAQLGLSLIELTVVLAITGVVIVPLTAIFRTQLRIPQKIAAEFGVSGQLHKFSQVLSEDARAAQAFTPGDGGDYGTFSWVELAGPVPIPIAARYFFESVNAGQSQVSVEGTGRVFRELSRGGQTSPPIIIIEGLDRFSDLELQVEEPFWAYSLESGAWSYAEGKVTALVSMGYDAGPDLGQEILTEKLVAEFRPQRARPVEMPPPG